MERRPANCVLGCALVVAALAGCSSSALVIEANQRPSPGSCELSQTRTGDEIDSGTFNLALGDRSTYVLTPLIRNPSSLSFAVERAHVTLQWEVDGALEPLSVTSEVGVRYDSWDLELDACASDACPVVRASSTASFEVPALPRVVTQYLGSGMDDAVAVGRVPPEYRLISTIVLEGTQGGVLARSEPFDFEIRLCLGCLVTFPEGTDSPGIAGPDCCGGAPPTPTCQAGQDDPIDCRACIGSLPEICNFERLSCGG